MVLLKANLERGIEIVHVEVKGRAPGGVFHERDPSPPRLFFFRVCSIDEDAPHHLGGDGQKMRLVPTRDSFGDVCSAAQDTRY
jgi:hypothetical protein